ncbi:hypothetical protein OUZ56_030527 [Daphnia magna]|uniref:Uncharacterized protein n=1 Tax=Daphnia magna TaxID=35525 RepID=A0ABQ9ZRK4_9CRUS|nr:hypothetical protein OUZ56_030527 [Daphnia magna]
MMKPYTEQHQFTLYIKETYDQIGSSSFLDCRLKCFSLDVARAVCEITDESPTEVYLRHREFEDNSRQAQTPGVDCGRDRANRSIALSFCQLPIEELEENDKCFETRQYLRAYAEGRA